MSCLFFDVQLTLTLVFPILLSVPEPICFVQTKMDESDLLQQFTGRIKFVWISLDLLNKACRREEFVRRRWIVWV